MSFTINTGKEAAQARRPVLLADFTFSDGSVWRAASIDCTYGGNAYVPAIDPPEVERLQYLSEQGIDRVPSASVTIADPDGSIFTTYERGTDKGFKGATLLLRLVLRDVSTSEWSTDSLIPFIGTCDQPSVDAKGLKVSATNKLNLSQDHLPQTAISARCPWINPATTQQRTEAADSNSRFYRCGETRSLATAPPCSYTRQTCTQPQRYGGSTWQPAKQGSGREYISGNRVAWTNPDTSGKYKQYWPEWLGGAAWVDVPVLNQWADANYTRGEAAVGIGQIDVRRVIVNGIELDQASSGDYRWHYVNNGARDGAHNTDTGYTDGDVYGNETVIQFLAPHATIDPNSTATVRVLGALSRPTLSIAVVDAVGTGTGPVRINFSGPAPGSGPGDGAAVRLVGNSWPGLDGAYILRYYDSPATDHAFLEGTDVSGSGTGGVLYFESSSTGAAGAVPSPSVIQKALKATGRFADPDFGTSWTPAQSLAAATLTFTDGGGNEVTTTRFPSAVALKDQRSVADIVRGVRQSMGALLYFGQDGKLEIAVEGPLAEQQPSAVDGSNYNTAITSTLRDGSTANGYAAYHFDRSNSRNLQRVPQQNSTSPNKVSFTFLDPANDWAVSTFAEFDPEDVSRMEQETAGGLQVQPEGIASYNFAYRCARLGLNKVLRGNPAGDTRGTDWWQWESSFRGCKLRPGQIVLLTNARLGLDHQQVRIATIKPAPNYETVTITAHHHSDAWYSDTPSTLADPERSYYHYTPPVPVAPGAPVPAGDVTIGTITVEDAHYTPTSTAKGRRIVAHRPLAIAYTEPSPIGTFKGVYVAVSLPDGETPPVMAGNTALDAVVSLAAPTIPQQFGPFAYSETGGSVRVEIPEPNWRTGASAITGRVRLISYSDEITNDAATAPSQTFTLSPPATTKPGAATAYSQNPTAISIPATFPDGTANPWTETTTGRSKTHLLVHQDAPDDPAFAGVAWRVSDDPDGLEIINASGPQKEADFELVFSTPATVATYYVWACGVDGDGNVNPIVPGITPVATVTLGTTGGTVDPRELIASWLESAEFHIDPTTGKFSMNGVDFTKAMSGTFSSEFQVTAGTFKMKSIAADIIATGVLEVGGAASGSTRVSRFKVFDTASTPNLIGWIGDDSAASGYVGAWFKRILIGGSSPATAQIVADSSGNVAISGSLIVGNIAGSAASITGTIAASQISAGTISAAVLLTSPSLQITSGTKTIYIDGTNSVKVTDSSSNKTTVIDGQGVKVYVTSVPTSYAQMHDANIYMTDGTNVTSITPAGITLTNGSSTVTLNNFNIFKNGVAYTNP